MTFKVFFLTGLQLAVTVTYLFLNQSLDSSVALYIFAALSGLALSPLYPYILALSR